MIRRVIAWVREKRRAGAHERDLRELHRFLGAIAPIVLRDMGDESIARLADLARKARGARPRHRPAAVIPRAWVRR